MRKCIGSKGLKVNVGKNIMMVGGTEGEIVLSKTDPCGKKGWV